MAPGGLAASLLLAALVALAPGQARAANESGEAISSTDRTRTCTATAYADGIIYLNVSPGVNNIATVNVPGGSTAWAITSGSGAGFEANGITLDSDEPAQASAGVRLRAKGDSHNLSTESG